MRTRDVERASLHRRPFSGGCELGADIDDTETLAGVFMYALLSPVMLFGTGALVEPHPWCIEGGGLARG